MSLFMMGIDIVDTFAIRIAFPQNKEKMSESMKLSFDKFMGKIFAIFNDMFLLVI